MSTATASTGARVLLADSRVVVLRIITPADADVVDMITRHSMRSPSRSHAVIGAHVDDRLVGFAHFEALPGSTTGEVALAVDGTVQARGLGTALIEHLASIGRHRGLTRFVAEVLGDNRTMIQAFADTGLPFRLTTTGPERRVEIALTEPADPTLRQLRT